MKKKQKVRSATYETTLCKCLPQQAEVLSTCEVLVCLDDRVPRLEEARSARLELHAVNHELDDESVAMAGDEAFRLAVSCELLWAVEVVLGHAAILERHRWEECVGPPVLINQLVRDDKEHLRPDLTDGMNAPVATLVEGVVRRRVDGRVERVRVIANAVRLVRGPRTHRPVMVRLCAADGGSQEVTPSFAHAS